MMRSVTPARARGIVAEIDLDPFQHFPFSRLGQPRLMGIPLLDQETQRIGPARLGLGLGLRARFRNRDHAGDFGIGLAKIVRGRRQTA